MPETKLSQPQSNSKTTPAQFFAAIALSNRESNIKKLSKYSFVVKDVSTSTSVISSLLAPND